MYAFVFHYNTMIRRIMEKLILTHKIKHTRYPNIFSSLAIVILILKMLFFGKLFV